MNGVDERGFTLVELLVTTVIALIVLGGLLMAFQSQYGEYKYQNKRVDAAQDVEFTMSFIADDLRGALHSSGIVAGPAETNAFAGTAASSILTFWVWDTAEAGLNATTMLAKRKYSYDSVRQELGYDRAIATQDTASVATALADTSANNDILRNVTFFKVFMDGVTPRGGFAGIPNALSSWNVNDGNDIPVSVPAYTILIEVAVDAGYKKGSFKDVKGVDVRTTADKRKRMWRYIQVHPKSAI